ncbi:Ig-like domain-containing protein [Marinobacterium weihaiense]|uniref:Cadherin-like domain-containing protein n=1 Tax=Marinobacterium weihaiense TaxID=2851016 RepID=A0ABS6ME80_9GAMM|nr:cadherin-like domain-containing protein [Marinobacterium weihaiense]MBV0934589.1 cadherin-like domain-containing protein [Marinobacterium weihaiense]
MALPTFSHPLSAPLCRSLAALAVTAALYGPAHAAPAHSAADVAHLQQQARQASSDLMALSKRWHLAKGQARKALQQQLLEQADQRRTALRNLVRHQPAEALQLAMPAQAQSRLPAEVINRMEQRLNLSGQLDVFYEDREDGSHRLRHILNTPFGERFELHFAGNAPQLKHGRQVELEGLLVEADAGDSLDGDIALSTETLMLAADGDATGGSTGGSAADSATLGAQSTLVINVNFSDNNSQPWPPEQARTTVFGEASAFLHENSFGQTWLEGEVTPWLTLGINSNGCDTSAITAAAHDAATAAGYDLSRYNRLIFAMPYTAGCGFSGVGSVGGTQSTMLINGSMYWFTIAHEMGHNLGLFHSHALECGDQVIGSQCSSDEYGDGVDIMGRVNGHFTTFQKERLGWLDSRHILTLAESGIHQLEPYAGQPGNAPKALKIPRGVDAASGQPEWLYVEYRQASGHDSILASNDNVQNGVVVHTGISNKPNSSFLLDMTPGSKASNYTDTRDPALEVGQQFTDPESGITLATQWVDGSRASVNVDMPGSELSCARANPVMNVTPGEPVWAPAGSVQTYTLTLTSRDSNACSSASYNLNTQVPAGWGSRLASSQLNLAPGETASVDWTVTSSETAADGYYTLKASALSGDYGTHLSLTQVVDTPVINTAPVAQSDRTSTAYETPVTLAVLANDTDADGDTLSVTAVSPLNGTAVINADNSITFSPASSFSGTTSFSYRISDGKGGSDSASITIDVAAAPNRAPVANNDSASTAYETPVTLAVLANDTDADGDRLSVTFVSALNGHAVVNADNSITFTPAHGFSGTASLSYRISDGKGGSDSASVSISVAAPVVPEPEPTPNAAPVARADSVTLDAKQSTTIAVLSNDYDPEGQALKVVGYTQGSKGSVRLNADGSLTYIPGKPFKQDDRFSYTISDGDKTATASVSIRLAADAGGGHPGKGNNK